jgi:hypothetical protein
MKLLAEPLVKSDEKMPQVWTSDRAHNVSREYLAGDGHKYRQEQAFAESKGLKLIPFSHSSELPKEAFVPKEP